MKKLFEILGTFFASIFKGVESFAKKHIEPSVHVMVNLRAALNGKLADIIVTLIPGTVDDKIRAGAISLLSKAIDAAQVTNDILNEPNEFAKVVKLIEYLKTLSVPMQKAVLAKLASEHAKQSAKQAGAEIPKGSIVDALVQLHYTKLKHNEAIEALETSK